MEIHFTPRDVFYLAGTCNACGTGHDKQTQLDRSSVLESGDCGLCGKMFCAECEYECDCCHKMVCKSCTKACVSCNTETCFRCLNGKQLCPFCRLDEDSLLMALSASHNSQYDMLSKGSWFCLSAAMIGGVVMLILAFIGRQV